MAKRTPEEEREYHAMHKTDGIIWYDENGVVVPGFESTNADPESEPIPPPKSRPLDPELEQITRETIARGAFETAFPDHDKKKPK